MTTSYITLTLVSGILIGMKAGWDTVWFLPLYEKLDFIRLACISSKLSHCLLKIEIPLLNIFMVMNISLDRPMWVPILL